MPPSPAPLRGGASALTTLLSLIVAAGAQHNPFPLRIVESSIVDEYGAKCLDGSPPGYYFRPASTPAGKNKWKIHFRGGGWAFTAAEAYGRTMTNAGSSKYFFPDVYNSTEGVYGVLNDNATNPYGGESGGD